MSIEQKLPQEGMDQKFRLILDKSGLLTIFHCKAGANMSMDQKLVHLKKSGANLTMQRQALLEYLQGCDCHPTAEDLYRVVRMTYPSISRATVYNNLDFFKKRGLIREITIERDKARYDPNIEPHCHFLCRQCGQICDVDIEPYPLVALRGLGHTVEELKVYIFGTCSTCVGEGDDA